jgi:prolyl 4-hydroxylase
MQRGEDLVVGTDWEEDETIARMLQQRYEHELSELRGYLNMAYPSSLKPVVPIKEVSRLVTGHTGTGNGGPPHDDHTDPSFQAAFHAINLDYPGLRYIHRNPDVLVIEDFLSGDECESIIANAEPHLIPCVVKHPTSGHVMQDPSRTSTNANLPQDDVPSIVDKLVQLTRCPDPTYLETLQVLRYTQGQQFAPHTDGFDGPTTACGYHQSGRLVTVFCYLNDVAEGGTTIFTKIHADGEKVNSDEEDKLVIQPRQGMAVVHFPATSGFEEDARTEHQGSEVKDHDKWLLTTWMWKDPRTDRSYHESRFPSLFEPARIVEHDP